MSESVVFATKGGATTEGVLSLPTGNASVPGLIVIHEFFGLNDYIKGVCARFAQEGFLTLAVDLYGGEVTDKVDRAVQLVQAMKTTTSIEIMAGAVAALKAHPRCNGKVGITGFCLGGGMTLAAVCNVEGLSAAVPFYGLPMAQYQKWENARAPIQGHFAENDGHVQKSRVTAAFDAARAAGVSVELHFYEGGHGFMRESDPSAFHAESAQLAWTRMLSFLRQHLTGL